MGSGFGRGLDYLAKYREEHGITGDGPKRDFLKQIWLADDQDKAIWFFLTDGNDIVFGPFHEEPRVSRNGKAFKADVACTGEGCIRCAAADAEPDSKKAQSMRPWVKGISLVYVEQIEHLTQKNTDWKPTKRGNLTVFIEKVGETRIWVVKSQMQTPLMTRFGERGNTLTDVYYEYRRHGARNQRTFYTLEPTAVTKLSPGCEEAVANHPDIQQVVDENFTDNSGRAAKSVEGIDPDDDPFGNESENPTSVPVDDDADELGFD